MRKIREVLRLKHELKLSTRKIERCLELGHGTAGEYLKRAERAGLTWAQARELSEADLEECLFEQVGRNEPWVRAPRFLRAVGRVTPGREGFRVFPARISWRERRAGGTLAKLFAFGRGMTARSWQTSGRLCGPSASR